MFIPTDVMAEASTPSTLDNIPDITELIDHVQTGKWKELAMWLKIKDVILAQSNSCIEMYNKWLQTKPEHETTRRKLITALEAINEFNLAGQYKKYLREVSLNK